MTDTTEQWVVAFVCSNGCTSTIDGATRFPSRETAMAEATRLHRQKPFNQYTAQRVSA